MENKHRSRRVEILKFIPGYLHSAPCSSIWRNVAPCIVPRRFINGLLMVLEVWDKTGRDDRGEKAPSVIVHLFEVRLPGNSLLLMASLLLKHTGRSHFFLLRCHLPVDGRISPSVSVTAAADGWERLRQKTLKIKRLPGRSAPAVEMRLLCVRFSPFFNIQYSLNANWRKQQWR